MASNFEFERLLREHMPRLRRFAFALSRDGADADDLVQTVAERALRAAGQWQAGTRFDSWLFRIARNQWIDTVRARSRHAKRFVPAEEGEAVGFDPRAATSAVAAVRARDKRVVIVRPFI